MWSFLASTTALTIEIAVTSAAGTAVQAISRPVCPWIGGPGGSSGKAVFTANGCDSCHTFTPAGANKKIGPDLDNLRQEAQRAGQPLEQFIRKSIVDPNAYVEPGFTKGLMPTSFSSLPKAQLDALVSYLAGGAKK